LFFLVTDSVLNDKSHNKKQLPVRVSRTLLTLEQQDEAVGLRAGTLAEARLV